MLDDAARTSGVGDEGLPFAEARSSLSTAFQSAPGRGFAGPRRRTRRKCARALLRPTLALLSLVVALSTGVSAVAEPAPSPNAAPQVGLPPSPANVGVASTHYEFATTIPGSACCRQRLFGNGTWLVEPANVLLSIPTLFLGVFGLFRWKRTGMAFNFLFGLLASYGVFSILYHASMQNGFYRMKDVALSLLQSFVVIMLSHSLYLYRVAHKGISTGRWYAAWASTVTLIFTIYPAAVHVAGESTANPWVAWVVFDLLWIVVAFQLILIWRRRHDWPNVERNAPAFRMVWYTIATCVGAYICWVLDKYVCGKRLPWLAKVHLHGIWHVLIGLSFYFMTSLARFFSAHEYGCEPVLEHFPARGPLRLPFIEWRPPLNAGTGASPAFRQPSTAPGRVPALPETLPSTSRSS